MAQGYAALTEKEKQTLRLLLAGHDAKSMAQHLGLSVHTVNERLRDARRKLAVSSSKEAARVLRQAEGADPQSFGDGRLGDVAPAAIHQQSAQPGAGPQLGRPAAWAIGGLTMILFLAATLALSTPSPAPEASGGASGRAATQTPVAESPATRAARDWIALVDAAKWAESWSATGRSFRSLNTVDAWKAAPEKARVPLGHVLSRELVGDGDVPAPPNGYRLVRFRTDFANKPNAVETISLDREGSDWRVVGIYIE